MSTQPELAPVGGESSWVRRHWIIVAAIGVITITTLGVVGRQQLTQRSVQIDASKSTPPVTTTNSKTTKLSAAVDPATSQFIQADFVELDKVYVVSKFRSGAGHDFSVGSDETCRSMKHYFTSIDPTQPDYKAKSMDKTTYPIPTIENDVKVFAPVDGQLTFVNYDQVTFNGELDIQPDAFPQVTIRLMHVTGALDVKEGHVTAGQTIGLVLANQSFDLAIESKTAEKTTYLSYFALLPDSIFTKYQARGVTSRDEMIISKEYRDAHPFSCHDKEVFDQNYAGTSEGFKENMVTLSGYDTIQSVIK